MRNRNGVYLDYAAATPVSAPALRAHLRALAEYGNPSAFHTLGKRAHEILEECRVTIARLAGIKSTGVVFTSGATEANTLAITGYVQALREKGMKDIEVLYVEGAHSSTVENMKRLERWGVVVKEIPLEHGEVSISELKNLLSPNTVLVSMEVVASETGARYDARAVRRALDEYAKEGYITLHVDASQLPYVESIQLARLGADLLTLDAQKIGGVRGVGALLVQGVVPLAPQIVGGGQERGRRSGTEPVALIASFAQALTEAEKNRERYVARAQEARAVLTEFVLTNIPDSFVNEGKNNVPHILNFSFINRDTDYAVALLSEAGFFVSTKSSCEVDSSNTTGAVGSRTVYALTRDTARSLSTLRVSWGPESKKSDLVRFQKALRTTIAFLDQNTAK